MGHSQYNYTISAAGRLVRVAIGTSVRADYIYDGHSRLVSRVTQNQVGAGTVRYVHDSENRIIAELNATGTTIREYAWLEDIPVAVLDGSTNTANPSLFIVQADHLNRPIAMSNASRDWVWRAQYEPFGAVSTDKDDGKGWAPKVGLKTERKHDGRSGWPLLCAQENPSCESVSPGQVFP